VEKMIPPSRIRQVMGRTSFRWASIAATVIYCAERRYGFATPTARIHNYHPGEPMRGYFGDYRSISRQRVACESLHTKKAFDIPSATFNNTKTWGDNTRTRTTHADIYFQKNGEISLPSQIHAVLPDTWPCNADECENILVIGDVHGCYDEMIQLWNKACELNHGKDFQYVILVGDLCNKGPDSAKVLRHVRLQPRWLTVRGNHDQAALGAALGDQLRRESGKYSWVMEGEGDLVLSQKSTTTDKQVTLSDDDVAWLAELPYTLTIPSSLLGTAQDTVIVHAGLVPNEPLNSQSLDSMLTIREVEECTNEHNTYGKQSYCAVPGKSTHGDRYPWASKWEGPYRVIFGHDARRGLQLYPAGLAVGLDTGAVYGKKLTGYILPHNDLVQVEATAVHAPIP
jgi:hypothetical protein